jgi:uncharacterized membrane protein (UPF0127 family)
MRLLLATLTLVAAGCSPQPSVGTGTVPDLDGNFEFDSLTVINDEGESLEFDIYLARTLAQRQQGLMWIHDLPATTGMLFIYPEDGLHSMWMRNTFISLDMVFVRSDGTIASVITNTKPRTLNSNAATEPVRFVLELNAGTTRLLQIGTNSRILWHDDDS